MKSFESYNIISIIGKASSATAMLDILDSVFSISVYTRLKHFHIALSLVCKTMTYRTSFDLNTFTETLN